MKNKFLAFVMVMAMALTMIPGIALAAGYELAIADFSAYTDIKSIKFAKYTISNNEYTDISAGIPEKAKVYISVEYQSSKANPMVALSTDDGSSIYASNADFTEYYFTMPAKNVSVQVSGVTNWEIKDGELIFSGEGELPSIGSAASYGKQPFNSDAVTKNVVIGEGITAIGNQFLAGSSSGDSGFKFGENTGLILPSTLASIKSYAVRRFNYSGAIMVPAAVTLIDQYGLEMDVTQIDLTKVGSCTFGKKPSICYHVVVYIDGENITSSQLSAVSDEKKTTIAVTNGGTFAEGTTFTANTLATPEKQNCTFMGWYDNEALTGEAVTAFAKGECYYAKWASNKTDIESVTVSGINGTVNGNEISVVLPEGSIISENPDDVTITVPDGVTITTQPATDDAGETWTFTVLAANGVTSKEYTIKVTIAAPAPNPASSGSGISVKYNGGNSFSTSKSDVPTSVEIDGVPVPFTGDGRLFTVNSIPAGAKWVTVRWNSTSVTTNFTPYGVYAAEVEIPKTGDISLWAAVLAFFGF